MGTIKDRLRKAAKKAVWLRPELLNPRSSAARARGILLHGLDEAKMDAFHDLFGNGGLSREAFVKGVRSILAEHQRLDQGHLYDIHQLYDEMDLDDTGCVRWDQFSTYMVRIAASKQHVQRDDLLKLLGYNQRPDLTEDMCRTFRVRDLAFAADLDALVIVEEDAPRLTVCRKPGVAVRWAFDEDKDILPEGRVTAVVYVSRHGRLAVAHASNLVTLWDVKPDRQIKQLYRVDMEVGDEETSLASRETIRGLCYAACCDRVMAYGPDSGAVRAWCVATRRLASTAELHASGILTALVIPKINRLATGGFDGTIVISELGTGLLEPSRVFGAGIHKHAVHSLAFVPSLGLLVSASFENEAMCWDPDISGYLSLQMRLVAHAAPLVALAAVRVPLRARSAAAAAATSSPSSSDDWLDTVVTLDADGVMRLWDLDKSRCGYDNVGLRASCATTFSIRTSIDVVAKPRFLVAAWGDGRCLVAATRHRAYLLEAVSEESTNPLRRDSDDETNPLCAHVRVKVAASEWTAQFCVVESRRATLVDAINLGQLKLPHQWNIAGPGIDVGLALADATEITAAACCPRMRRLYVGDATGGVAAYSIGLGIQVARYASHDARVVHLELVDDVVLSVGADVLAAHDGCVSSANDDRIAESAANDRTRLRAVYKAHEQAITSVAVYPRRYVATASQDSSVRLWAFCSFRLDALWSAEAIHSEPLALAFLEPRPALVVAETSGAVTVFPVATDLAAAAAAAPPVVRLIAPAYKISVVVSMAAAAYSSSSSWRKASALYAGDEAGVVRMWRLDDDGRRPSPFEEPTTEKNNLRLEQVWRSPHDSVRGGARGKALQRRLAEHRELFHASRATFNAADYVETLSSGKRLRWGGLRSVFLALRRNHPNFDLGEVQRVVEPALTRRCHEDVVAAIELARVSARDFLITVAKTASIRLWDLQLAPVACIFGDENPTRFDVQAPQHRLLRTLHRAMDAPFSESCARAAEAEAAASTSPPARTKSFCDHEGIPLFRKSTSNGTTLRQACVERVKDHSSWQQQRPRTAPETPDDDPPEPEYENHATEVARVLSSRLCYHLRSQDLLTAIIRSTNARNQPPSALARRRSRGTLSAAAAADGARFATPAPDTLPNGMQVGSFEETGSVEEENTSLCSTPAFSGDRRELEAALAKAAVVRQRFEALLTDDDARSTNSKKARPDKNKKKKKKKKNTVITISKKKVCLIEENERIPTEFVRKYGRFGPYDVHSVLACRDFFREFDVEDVGEIDMGVMRSKVRTETAPQVKAILETLLAAVPKASTCSFDTFLETVLPHASRNERSRAIATIGVLDMLGRVRDAFASFVHHPSRLSLPTEISTEIGMVFDACRDGTVTLRDVPALLNAAPRFLVAGSLQESDADKLAAALALDKDQELDAADFGAMLIALAVAQRKRLNDHRGLLSPASSKATNFTDQPNMMRLPKYYRGAARRFSNNLSKFGINRPRHLRRQSLRANERYAAGDGDPRRRRKSSSSGFRPNDDDDDEGISPPAVSPSEPTSIGAFSAPP
ncbi:hypothetical protein CTAYLR_008859 [Chrysophaeum taylorii]|uniref:Uncharacterized protein n=1 Tax=Chrysophaeum taylorii TaxID=2483200 RepID=A0AAD7UP52_9STRA|nr:hypothetical protein CTAYLR_008859 [Chrysophaeum taylorii]